MLHPRALYFFSSFLFMRRESSVLSFYFMKFGTEKQKEKTPHKIKRYRSENQKVSRGAVRLDASKLSNSACIRYSSLFRSYFQPSHSRIVDFFRDTTSRTLASAGLDKNQLFPCHKFRTLEICIDRSFTHPPFYNFPSN